MIPATEWKFCSICFLSYICENTHRVWYKNLWNWRGYQNLMIFDLLTSPQGHTFDPRIKILLAFCSARHPRRFDMPHNHVWNFFDPLGTPSTPMFDPWGMTQATEWKSRLVYFVYFICENKHKVWYKNLWNWLCNYKLSDIWPFYPSPRSQRAGPKTKCCCTPNSCKYLTHQIWLNFVQRLRRRYHRQS